MDILTRLKAASVNTDVLDLFIEKNIRDLYDLMLYSRFDELNKHRDDIDGYILANLKTISLLDLNKANNQTFISILLEVAERFSFGLSFSRLYSILKKNGIEISSRLDATNIYNLKIRNFQDCESIFDEMFEKLLLASDEDDDNDKIFAIAINFYAKIVHDYGSFNLPAVQIIKNKISDLIKSPEYKLFDNDIINKVLNLEIRDHELAFKEIQNLLDDYLTKTKSLPELSLSDYLLEIDTTYSIMLNEVILKFEHIRQISVNSYGLLNESKDVIFRSLGRGVTILDEEKQLFAYMNSYSNMHYEKLRAAFNYLPESFYENSIKIYDWGCGQGMASLTYLDYLLHDKNITQNISKITLIEPSELALRRAALHVLKYNPDIQIKTINKDFDSLESKDIIDLESDIKLHLFSNVLDIDQFSLTSLIKLLDNNVKGLNYCICVSPFINTLKANRLNVFMENFSSHYDYEKIISVEKKSGEWLSSWTKVIRIFKYYV